MAIVESDGIVKILTDEGYTKTFIVKEDNSTGSFNVGKVHVPKLFIGKKAFLTVGFEE
jgi:putative transposon-encoded protein